MAEIDFVEMTDAELDQLRDRVVAEVERRAFLANAPARQQELNQQVLTAEGVEMGQEWGPRLMGYSKGWTVTRDGKEWESLISGNVWPPGDPGDPQNYRWWKDLSAPVVGAWSGAGVAYTVGDEVTYMTLRYRCRQSHVSQPTWMPTAVPALWEPI